MIRPNHVSFRFLYGLLVLITLLGAGCGGGGSSTPAATLTVSPLTLTTSAMANQPAPNAFVGISISNAGTAATTYYYQARWTSNGIDSISAAQGQTQGVIVQFKDPSSLLPGVYNDTITVEGCYQQSCASQVQGSPQTVQVQYTVTPATPGIASISPSAAYVGGGAFTLTLTGQYFTSQSVVQWSGVSLATTFVSSTQLTAQVPASAIATVGSDPVTVSTDGTVSQTFLFNVNTVQAPVITLINPYSSTAGTVGFTVSVTGINFDFQSVVNWNGAMRQTTFVSPTRITAQITAADIANPGTVPVTVTNVSLTSAPSNFVVEPAGVLAIASVSPSFIDAGGAGLTLQVNGAGFGSSSVVQWNGNALATTLVSSTVLQAQVPSSALAVSGTAYVTVKNTTAPVGTSLGATVRVEPMALDAVATQITPAHTGVTTFQNVALPANALWQISVSGEPSFALVGASRVFIVVNHSAGIGPGQLMAVDPATGAALWSVPLLSLSGAAYDNGTVFVVCNDEESTPQVQAYDAVTGMIRWSTPMGGFPIESSLTAANGLVYSTSIESGSVYAMDEMSGAVVWSQAVVDGTTSTPAVTGTGLYVSYYDDDVGLNPLTGTLLWDNHRTGSSGAGGGTPVVANGLVYAPGSGNVLVAATGATMGTFAADNPPAIGSTTGYFLQSGVLTAIDLSTQQVQWTFSGDGQLVSSPILVSGIVFVGSSAGNVYALDAISGQQLWQANTGSAIYPGGGGFDGLFLPGLSAGAGLLIVPSANSVTAYKLSASP